MNEVAGEVWNGARLMVRYGIDGNGGLGNVLKLWENAGGGLDDGELRWRRVVLGVEECRGTLDLGGMVRMEEEMGIEC